MFDALRKRRLRRLLRLRRAWSQVAAGPDPDRVSRLADRLSLTAVPWPVGVGRLIGLPEGLDGAAERAVRQNLLLGLYTELMPGIMSTLSGRPEAIGVPASWRRSLADDGLVIPPFRSRLRYARTAAVGWLRGVRLMLRTLGAAVRGDLEPAPPVPYDVALEFPATLVPVPTATADVALLPWLAAQGNTGPFWVHTATDRPLAEGLRKVVSPLPAFPGPIALARFAVTMTWTCMVTAAAAAAGRPEPALILPELVRLTHARCVGSSRLARSYLAENSRWFLRPLFTEWAREAAGSEAVLAFYSTNNDECLRLSPTIEPSFVPGYRSMSWDRYLVWDEHHADLVGAWGHAPAKARTVGVVPMLDSLAPLPDFPLRSVAVFDVAPFLPAMLAQMGLVPSFYTGKIAADFLLDIRDACAELDATMIVKQKRSRRKSGPPIYEAALGALLADPVVQTLDPSVGAARVAQKTLITLSMPFSSPSVIASQLGRPSAYYDPTGLLVHGRRQRHDLPVLAGPAVLLSWLEEALDNAQRDSSGSKP